MRVSSIDGRVGRQLSIPDDFDADSAMIIDETNTASRMIIRR